MDPKLFEIQVGVLLGAQLPLGMTTSMHELYACTGEKLLSSELFTWQVNLIDSRGFAGVLVHYQRYCIAPV